jgi:hypothetical protein
MHKRGPRSSVWSSSTSRRSAGSQPLPCPDSGTSGRTSRRTSRLGTSIWHGSHFSGSSHICRIRGMERAECKQPVHSHRWGRAGYFLFEIRNELTAKHGIGIALRLAQMRCAWRGTTNLASTRNVVSIHNPPVIAERQGSDTVSSARTQMHTRPVVGGGALKYRLLVVTSHRFSNRRCAFPGNSPRQHLCTA